MVVDRNHRNQSHAKRLLTTLLRYAEEKQVRKIYLITTTAEAYFMSKGFTVIDRQLVPSGILASPEFSTLCPSTATIMIKQL
jgi:amino-acid N-acetyltransferase